MLPSEIRAAITADPALQALVPNTVAIAAALSVGRFKVQKTNGGIGLVMETLGPETGAQVLDSLDAMRTQNSALKWAWYLLERGDLDFGSPATRGMISALFAENAPVRDALLSVALVPDPVDEYQVRAAIYADTGELLV